MKMKIKKKKNGKKSKKPSIKHQHFQPIRLPKGISNRDRLLI